MADLAAMGMKINIGDLAFCLPDSFHHHEHLQAAFSRRSNERRLKTGHGPVLHHKVTRFPNPLAKFGLDRFLFEPRSLLLDCDNEVTH